RAVRVHRERALDGLPSPTSPRMVGEEVPVLHRPQRRRHPESPLGCEREAAGPLHPHPYLRDVGAGGEDEVVAEEAVLAVEPEVDAVVEAFEHDLLEERYARSPARGIAPEEVAVVG